MDTQQDPNLGREYADPTSRLGRFIDEQHYLLEKTRNQLMFANQELRRIESESEYWKKECEKSDKNAATLRSRIADLEAALAAKEVQP